MIVIYFIFTTIDSQAICCKDGGSRILPSAVCSSAVQHEVPNIPNADELVSYFDQFNYRQWKYFNYMYTGPWTITLKDGIHVSANLYTRPILMSI